MIQQSVVKTILTEIFWFCMKIKTKTNNQRIIYYLYYNIIMLILNIKIWYFYI